MIIYQPMSLLNAGISPSVLPGQFIKSDGIRKTWKISQLMAQDYWKKWQHLYLPTLIPRKKWNSPQPNFKIGDLILLKDYTLVKNQWSHARVGLHNIFPNKDGKVRCLDIRKPDGTILSRDICNVCKLESDFEYFLCCSYVTVCCISTCRLARMFLFITCCPSSFKWGGEVGFVMHGINLGSSVSKWAYVVSLQSTVIS